MNFHLKHGHHNRLRPIAQVYQRPQLDPILGRHKKRIRAAGKFRPDRAVGYAISEAKVAGNTLVADGAAFRSKKKWYRLSYTCTTTPDRMKVLKFEHAVGAEIPQERWSAYGLWK